MMSIWNMEECGAGVAKLSRGCCVTRNETGDVPSFLPDVSVGPLQFELAKIQDEHQACLAKITWSLSELSAKLNGMESSWTPWEEARALKQEVTVMKSALDS